jgi:hypothetical protein
VLTPAGQPASGVEVKSFSIKDKDYSFVECKTDAKGRFRLVVTTPGTGVFWVLPEKFVSSLHALKDGKRGDLGTFKLQAGLTLRGKVLGVRGKPLAGVQVSTKQAARIDELEGLPVGDMSSRSAVTNAQGEFVMPPLAAGDYFVHAVDREGNKEPALFMDRKVVLKKDKALEIRAVSHVVLDVQFYDKKGKPAPGPRESFAIIYGDMDNRSTHWTSPLVRLNGKGKMRARVPHGLENTRIHFNFNFNGVRLFSQPLEYRLKKGGKLQRSSGDVRLGTVLEDLNIEIILLPRRN